MKKDTALAITIRPKIDVNCFAPLEEKIELVNDLAEQIRNVADEINEMTLECLVSLEKVQ